MTTLPEIEKKTLAYSQARSAMAALVAELNEARDAITRSSLPRLRRNMARIGELHDELNALIEDAPSLFEKPRTQTFHGIKVGYAKAKGGLDWDDEDAVVDRIERFLPEQADTLLATKKRPVKDALAQLPARDLKRLGVEIVEAGDQVVIRPQDSDIEKLARALMGKDE